MYAKTMSHKSLQALAVRLNATDAETLRGDEIIAMIRTSIREIIAINVGCSGVTGAIVKFGDRMVYTVGRSWALSALLQ